jgi:hypothetical protein
MNEDQANSLVRTLLKVAAGLFAAHGMQNTSTLLNGPDLTAAALLIVGLLWSHYVHSSPPLPGGGSPPTGGGTTTLLFLLAGSLWLGTGCKITPQQVAYRSAGTTVVSVDAAMNLWGAYVAAQHPSTNVETQVKSAYEKYQADMTVVCDAGAIYSASGTNTTGAAALNQAISSAGQDLLDLENLLTTVGVKLQ